MASPNVAITGSLDPVSYRNLQRDLRALSPEIQKELNTEIRGIAGELLSSAQRYASWSSRIPGSLAISATSTRVGVKAKRSKAPHARAYEGVRRTGFGSQASFRHPVFGSDRWVSQSTRPFIAPAIRDHQKDFYAKAEEAVTNAARHVGWK